MKSGAAVFLARMLSAILMVVGALWLAVTGLQFLVGFSQPGWGGVIASYYFPTGLTMLAMGLALWLIAGIAERIDALYVQTSYVQTSRLDFPPDTDANHGEPPNSSRHL